MRVLVTRPRDDAEETAAKLAARGHLPLVAPLLDIGFREGPEIALEGIQAVLVTSANGIRALAQRTNRRDVPVLAVGAQSAKTARTLGFSQVRHADGDAAALAELAATALDPRQGALLHAAGADTRGPLSERLVARGFEVRSAVLYDAVSSTIFPEPVREALVRGELDAVLLFSPRSARIFAELAVEAGVVGDCEGFLALCISRATADALRSLRFREVRVASRPNEDAVLALLEG